MSAPYHPGQSPWPDNQSQRPDRPPPIQFQADEQAPRGNPVLAWSLRVVGLIAVAVISGVVWWYIQNDGGSGGTAGDGSDTQQQSGGRYQFTEKLDSPKVDTSCGDHAYGETQRFLEAHACDRLTRQVFTTTTGGRKVYTSVSVVKMPDEDTAGSLRQLVDRNGSGNVNDLVREKKVNADGLPWLSGGSGYASAKEGTQVVIVEADYDPKKKNGGREKELDDVCQDALRLGKDIVANSGG